jgi:hypothetical protein
MKLQTSLTLFDVLDGVGLLDATNPYNNNKEVSCDEAIDNLILGVPDLGSVFYTILNAWYLGQWGDYESCNGDTTGG